MSDWMYVTIIAPAAVGTDVLASLKERHGFVDTDWCVMERPDFGRADCSPCAPLTTNFHGDRKAPGAAQDT